MEMDEKHSQVVVITGASAGVGRAAAVAFAKQEAKIALLARGEELNTRRNRLALAVIGAVGVAVGGLLRVATQRNRRQKSE